MAYVWVPFMATSWAAAVLSLAAGLAVYFGRPWSARNRWLALALFGTGIIHLTNCLMTASTDPLDARAWRQAHTFFLLGVPWAYLLFAGTLETPLAAPLRSRVGRAVLVLLLVGLPWLSFHPAVAPLPTVRVWYAPSFAPPSAAIRAFWQLVGLLFVAVLVLAVSAWRRAPPASARRRELGGYLAVFAARDAVMGGLFLLYPWLRFRGNLGDVVYVQSAALMDVLAAVILAYGVLRGQVLGVDLKIKWTIRQSTVAAAFVAVFFAASEGAQAAFEGYGTVVGIAAATVLVFAIHPLQGFASRVADRAMPRVREVEDMTAAQRLDLYRAAVEGVSRADDPAAAARMLAGLRATLGVDEDEHARVVASAAREDLRHRVERRGRYRVVRELGRGGQGRALLARDLDLDREVVLKEPLDLGRGEAARDRFLAEARAAARIHHPNVLAVHAVLADEDPPLLVLEYAPGGSLDDLLRREGPLPEARAAALAADVLRGLARLHAAGLVHRDVTPRNVLLDAEGGAKVADFGLASPAGAAYVAGTPGYAAPEAMRGAPLDARSDVWGVGALLHAALTGRAPDAGATGDALRPETVLVGPAPRLPDTPLARLVARALAGDPAERFADARDMLAALEATRARPGAAGVAV